MKIPKESSLKAPPTTGLFGPQTKIQFCSVFSTFLVGEKISSRETSGFRTSTYPHPVGFFRVPGSYQLSFCSGISTEAWRPGLGHRP